MLERNTGKSKLDHYSLFSEKDMRDFWNIMMHGVKFMTTA